MKLTFRELIKGPLMGLNTAFYTKLCLSQVDVKKTDSVLNIGIGSGHLEYLLSGRASSILGLDISQDMIDILNNDTGKPKNVDFIQLDATEDCPARITDAYDISFCMDVLEHIEDPSASLRFIYQSLNQSGVAVITFPINNHNHGCNYYDNETVSELLARSPFNKYALRYLRYDWRAEIASRFYIWVVTTGQKIRLLRSSDRVNEVPMEASLCFSIKRQKQDADLVYRFIKFGIAIIYKLVGNTFKEKGKPDRVLVVAEKKFKI